MTVEQREPLIVLTADHGEHLGELWERRRFSFGHGKFIHAGGVHVPLILWWGDRLVAGTELTNLVSLVDVPATIFALVDEGTITTQGSAFLSPTGPEPAQHRYVFVERSELDESYRLRRHLPEQQYGVRDAHHSLIVSLPDDTAELFDLDDDPLEQVDVSAAQPLVRDRLRTALDAWLRATPDAHSAPLDETRIETLRALGYIE